MASIAGYLTKSQEFVLPFPHRAFNGLTALANANKLFSNDFDQLPEREIVDLQQGDYEEMDQLAIAKPYVRQLSAFFMLKILGLPRGQFGRLFLVAQVAFTLICQQNYSLR